MNIQNSNIFQSSYVIVTILIVVLIGMVFFGVYFMKKSVKISKGTVEKSFCSLHKIESDFMKTGASRKNRTVVYISVPLGALKRLNSGTKANRIYDQLKYILFKHLCISIDGDIAVSGSENFIALNSLKTEEIAPCIEKCLEEINDKFVEYDVVHLVRIRFGYICTSSNEISFETALNRAKEACSIAEEQDVGYCQWDTSNGKEFERKMKMENNIQSEIDNNHFYLEYQPIVNTKTSGIIGAEVLTRLNSASEGILSPYLYLAAVNNVGLNKKFDYYVFEKNCKWISSDIQTRSKYMFSVNFSRQTLCDQNLVDFVMQCIQTYGINASSVAIEILEDTNLTEDEKSTVTKNLTRLKGKGITILLDDFGKGYTSFSDLTDFSIDIVKIDRSITQGAVEQAGFLILKNIIKTAHDLGYKTLCEGVETEEHRKVVAAAGCDMIQGYYFHRPMPVAKLETLLIKK